MADTPTPRADTIRGSSDDDVLAGFDGNDEVRGGAGDDLIIEGLATWVGPPQFLKGESTPYLDTYGVYDFGRGDDRIYGGDGYDFVGYFGASDPVRVNFETGVIKSSTGVDRIFGVEGVITGLGDDKVIADISGVSGFLEEGDDKLVMFGDASYFDGGDGDDTIDVRDATKTVTIDLAASTASIGSRKNAVLENFENVTGASDAKNVISGNEADNQVSGGSKADRLSGKRGDDTLKGAAGSDLLYGDRGDDFLKGGAGADTLKGGDGDDELRGGGGADSLYGGEGQNVLYGDKGADLLVGGAGYSMMYGGDGNDTLKGDFGSFFGEQGDDVLTNTGGAALYGGDGNDTLNADASATSGWIDGGSGDDRIVVNGNPSGGMTIDGGDGFDTLYFEGDSLIIGEIEYILYSGANVVNIEEITISENANEIVILEGSWDFELGDSSNIVRINSEGNTITTGTGADRLYIWGAGNTVNAGAGNDDVQVLGQDQTVNTGDGDDQLDISGSNQFAATGEGGDRIQIDGTSSGVVIDSGDGDDWVSVRSEVDLLTLGAGDDEAVFAFLDDESVLVSGGTGADTYEFVGAHSAQVTISDFDPAEDTLQFFGVTSTADFTSATQVGDDTVLVHSIYVGYSGVELTLLNTDLSSLTPDVFV